MAGLAVFVLGCGVIWALAARRAPIWVWAFVVSSLTLALEVGTAGGGRLQLPLISAFTILGWIPLGILWVFCIPGVRRAVLVRPAFRAIRRGLPLVTDTARQSLGVGTVGFEAEFFSGRPNFDKMRAIPALTLSEAEGTFLDGPTEELCRMIDDWSIRHEHDIPDRIWSFLKSEGFFALRIGREHGGHGFSPQAVSLILGKVASRSPDIFGVLMIPNSLGVAELLERYGTDEQKKRHLTGLAKGDELACLALTGPTSGSDAASMRDIGVVARGDFRGIETLGIRVSWDKRYIALAPRATLVGLAFRLFDPHKLLSEPIDGSITVAIIPVDHPGVVIGRCHLPSGGVLPVGPTQGRDVFIPLSWVIGGQHVVGQGWRMLMESVAASRAIALPACAAAGIKSVLRTSGAYGRIRKQFGAAIATMEGVEEPLARMVETAYVAEAARAVTAAMVGRGERPSVISALMKYQLTERLRRCVNDAMDVHGGRAVCDGPANYLQSIYQMVPIAVTIEGANIVTRALVGFTQGAVLSHPYFAAEMQGCQDKDEKRGFALFERALLGHISFLLSNATAALFHNLTGARWAKAAAGSYVHAEWHRELWRASRNFALLADLTIVLVGKKIRVRQKLTGRLSDALSELYLLACVLKRFEDDGSLASDANIVSYCARNALHRFQEAVYDAIDNFPVRLARPFLKTIVFPLGRPYRRAPDRLAHEIVKASLTPGDLRDRLTRYIYVSKNPEEPAGLLEQTLERVVHAEEVDTKLEQAIRRGIVRRYHGIDWISEAVTKSVITADEAKLLREVETLSTRVITVDDFDPDEIKPNYMTPGHNVRAAHIGEQRRNG